MENKSTGYWNVFNILYFIGVTVGNLVFFERISSIIQSNQLLRILYQLIMFYDLILFFSLLIFKINYGPFGRLKRAQFPNDRIVGEFKSFGRIGLLPVDNIFSKWIIFEHGLGIKLFGIIQVYIPKENLKMIGNKQIKHNSPEIYNPITSSEDIINRLKID